MAISYLMFDPLVLVLAQFFIILLLKALKKGGIMLYRLNPQKSMMKWHGKDASEAYNGTLKFKTGTFVEELNKLVEGKLNLDMLSFETRDTQLDEKDNQKLTEQLKSKDFLSVDKFPEASFETKEVFDHKGYVDLKGVLKFKGYAFGFAFPVKVNKKDDQLMLEGNLEMKDINPAIRQFLNNGSDELPDVNIDYKIVADPAES